MEENLINRFLKIKENVKDGLNENRTQKLKNLKFQHDVSFYEELVYHPLNKDNWFESFSIDYEIVNDHYLSDLFDYFRYTTSSMPQCQTPGRNMKILIKEANSQKYCGLLQFSTDLLKTKEKDEFIFGTLIQDQKRNRLKQFLRDHSLNITICVPLQPFGNLTCGGKLLAMLSFSKELIQEYEKRFGFQIALISTTSIHGKSIQYDRLKELKLIGYTQGFGTYHIPEDLFTDSKLFLQSEGVDFSRLSKHNIIKETLKRLNVPNHEEILNHGEKKGIYCGMTSDESSAFLLKTKNRLDQNRLGKLVDIVRFWLKRWGINRRQKFDNKVI